MKSSNSISELSQSSNNLKFETMKNKAITFLGAAAFLLLGLSATAQIGGWNPELVKESNEAMETMLEESPKLQTFYDEAYGYAVFPKVTKGAIGVGGAAGNGLVYQNHEVVSSSKLKQATVGFQLGGQQYSEVLFFKNKESFDRFINGKLKFGAQASAVALKEGASIDAAYSDGVAVFTQSIAGLMYEASIGGQHFKNTPIEKD